MEQELTYRLGESVFDPARGTLHRGGELVVLRAKTFELLAYMVRNAGRVISKDELLRAIWPVTTVTEDSLTQCIRDARKCIGDEEQAIIRTVPRRGYMFRLPALSAALRPLRVSAPSVVGTAPAEPRVAVLPFRLAIANEAMRPIFEGVVEEITAALCYFKTVTVLARYSAMVLAQTPAENMQAALADAGADYLVEGEVSGGNPLFHVVITLCNVRSGQNVWSQIFSFEPEGVFAFHQSVARRVTQALVFNIESSAMQHVSPEPTRNIQAYVELMLGIRFLRSDGDGVNERALEHLTRAIELDPQSDLAHAYLAAADAAGKGYSLAPPETLSGALQMALRGVALSPNEARCHRLLGLILGLRRDFQASERHYRQSLELNPYDADTLAQLGWLLSTRGRAEEGLAMVDQAMEINPLHPPYYYFDRGEALFLLGRYREAAQSFSSLPLKSGFRWAMLSACNAMEGDPEQAALCMRQAHEVHAEISYELILRNSIMEHESDKAKLRHALRMAGWEPSGS